MSNAIQFLETLGRRSALIDSSVHAYAETIASLEIGDAQKIALLDRDHARLSDLLSDRTQMLCLICTPDDEQEAIPDDGDKDGDSVPDDPSPDRE